ncbi:MAG: cytochrome c [bacterium]|nr:cytochrome c [bacterium]
MKKISLTLLSAGLLMGAAAFGADGAAIFKAKMCGACHGPGKKAGDLKNSKMDKPTMVKFMKDPKASNPKAAMPAFKGSDEELNVVVDYILSLRK